MMTVSAMYAEGMDLEEIGRAHGLTANEVRIRLRKSGKLDHVPTNVWDLDQDEQRIEFAKRASRGAGRTLRQLQRETAL